jgi:hypothetical protein
MLRPRLAPILFSRQVQPACICLPSKIGCQTWTRTKTSGLTNRRATLTPPGNGLPGRSQRRRLALPAGFPPACFRLEDGCLCLRPRQQFENGQRGRSCTCDHSGPSRACCCYTTRWMPRRSGRRRGLGSGGDGSAAPWTRRFHRRVAAPAGLAPALGPQTTGCFSVQLRSH